MGHLSILLWIKVRYDQNTFTALNFSNFIIFDQKICFKIFGKGKNYKSRSRIRTQDLQICIKRSNQLHYAIS